LIILHKALFVEEPARIDFNILGTDVNIIAADALLAFPVGAPAVMIFTIKRYAVIFILFRPELP